jgi:hypothetical protein
LEEPYDTTNKLIWFKNSFPNKPSNRHLTSSIYLIKKQSTTYRLITEERTVIKSSDYENSMKDLSHQVVVRKNFSYDYCKAIIFLH